MPISECQATFGHQWDDDPQIVLASASPQRHALLRQIGVRHTVQPVDVDESVREGDTPSEYVRRLALAKARVRRMNCLGDANLPVLGADTAVVVHERILGKPKNRESGIEMLKFLSGREHKVMSAVALVDTNTELVRLQVSCVRFRTLSHEECEQYWASGEPAGKAGAYAIQGRAAAFVVHLAGSYSGVVGLPLFETAELLRERGISVPKSRPGNAT